MAAAERLPEQRARFLTVEQGLLSPRLPLFFARDFSSSCVGHSELAFAKAKQAFEQWKMFDLGWVRVANPEARIVPGQLVAVEAQTLGLWTLSFSRILEVVASQTRFGFSYGTTAMHVEEGEERFLLELDPSSGKVTYTIEAVSRPRNAWAQLGYAVARMFQHQFARDSHRCMREAVQRKPRSR
jgi:uncharacterized protein (UPF0548 family)